MKLQRLEINNFKSVNHAVIEELGPINVIFGPTNSGKTSLLESLYFQFRHQQITDLKRYDEFLHSKADPKNAELTVRSRWLMEEIVAAVDLRPNDLVECVTNVQFSGDERSVKDEIIINGKLEGNLDREQAISSFFQGSIKLSSSRRPGDTKSAYYTGEETNEERQQRFLLSLQELKRQGGHYQEFLSRLQKLFPHLVYGNETEHDIIDFFGMGFLSTAKLFVYLFDARYQLVLIDEPEIHFYPSLTRRFVNVLHEVVELLNKQIIIGTHSTLFLQERRLGSFYHASKSQHFLTQVRKVDQNNLLEGLDMLNTPPEAILQSDIVIYTEGPSDIGVMQEFLGKFSELDHADITVLHLGGGSMGNLNVDPLDLKKHNPLSFVLVDSERVSHSGQPDAAHEAFLRRCHRAHLYCMMLERQALENYFTPRALRAVFDKKIPNGFTNAPYKPLTEQGLPWYEKSSNRDVARAMTREEIEAFADLREFFQEILDVNKHVQ